MKLHHKYILFASILFFIVFTEFKFPSVLKAQGGAGSGSCSGPNACLTCDNKSGCCAIEGPGGYNCGPTGTTGGGKTGTGQCKCGRNCVEERDRKTGEMVEKCSGCIKCCANQDIPTQPTIQKVTPTSNGVNIEWSVKIDGNVAYTYTFYQNSVYFDKSYTKVITNCPNNDCQVNFTTAKGFTTTADYPSSSVSTQAAGTTNVNKLTYYGGALEADTVYYLKVVLRFGGSSGVGCFKSDTSSTITSCSISPSTASFNTGASQVYSVNLAGTDTSFMAPTTYNSSNTSVATISNSSQTFPFYATLLGRASGTSTLTSTFAPLDGTSSPISCVATANVSVPVVAVDPWWRAVDADIVATDTLNNSVPSNRYQATVGIGGYPGVVSYKNSTNLTAARASTLGWFVKDSQIIKPYSYQYLRNLLAKDIVVNTLPSATLDLATLPIAGNSASDGYYYYEFDATSGTFLGQDLTITGGDIGNNKIVIFAKGGDVNITGNTLLNNGSGFLMVVATEDVHVSADSVEALIFTEKQFDVSASAVQFNLSGAVAANQDITLNRDLGAGNTSAAEVFTYAPDQVFLFPKALSERNLTWKEVAP